MINKSITNHGNQYNLEKIKVQTINEKIIAYSNQKIRLDIEEGKMGFCIYFFKLSRLLQETQYQKLAENLLNDIYAELGDEPTVRAVYELVQIGMGIDYLVRQNYVKGNINAILTDIDNLIFKKLAFEKVSVTYQTTGIIPILYYICIRIKQQNKGSDARFISEELCIKLFNDLYLSLDSGFYEEPFLFNILDYRLPQFLYVVNKMYSLQFYNYRIVEVLKEISGLILSKIPVLHANRLYLLWSLLNLKETTVSNTWDEQIDILANHIDYQKIIYRELRNRDVFIRDGVAGIYLLLNALKNTYRPIPFEKNIFQKKIEKSEIWKAPQAFGTFGLINGFGGALLIYNLIINEK